MLELMYAAGLRVSELVGLPATAVNLRQGVLRVTGKGSKERLVPLGEASKHWRERYLAESRPQLAGTRSPPVLFPGPRRAQPSRRHLWTLVQRSADAPGHDPDTAHHPRHRHHPP